MKNVPYLTTNRVGTYLFLRRYPTDLATFFDQPHRKVNLKTKDRVQAEEAVRRLAVAFDDEIRRLRATRPADPGSSQAVREEEGQDRDARRVRLDDIPVIAQRAAAAYLHTDELERAKSLSDDEFDAYEAGVREHHAQLSRDVARGRLQPYQPEVLEIVENEGLCIDEQSSLATQLTQSVVFSLQQAVEQVIQRLAGRPVATPPAPPPPRSEFDLDDLNRAFDHWVSKRNPTIKTRIETKATLERFIKCTGHTRISQLSTVDAVQFQNHEQATRTAKPQTLNKGMALIRAVVQLACDDVLHIDNPLDVTAIRVLPGMRDERQEYLPEEIRTLFASPVYSANLRPDAGAGEAAFWLPLLGYTSGARLDELGQLTVDDVLVREDGLTLRIRALEVSYEAAQKDSAARGEVHEVTAAGEREQRRGRGKSREGADKRVKNDTSVRKIPVHSALLAIGFAEYVSWIRSKGARWLFPELVPDHLKCRTGLWSRWYNRYLDSPAVGLDIEGL